MMIHCYDKTLNQSRSNVIQELKNVETLTQKGTSMQLDSPILLASGILNRECSLNSIEFWKLVALMLVVYRTVPATAALVKVVEDPNHQE